MGPKVYSVYLVYNMPTFEKRLFKEPKYSALEFAEGAFKNETRLLEPC